MTFHSQTLSSALSAMVADGHPVNANPNSPWVPYEALVAELQENRGQFSVVDGETEGGHMLEVFTSTTPGEWTIVMKRENGLACEVAKSRTTVSTVAPLVLA